ncbi:hypothetical protein H5410_001043, partial [Solanum commersonii]
MTKEKAINPLEATPSDSYNKLPSYLYILDTNYPGSRLRMKKIDENQFCIFWMTTTSWETYNGNILSLAYDIVNSKNDASCWIGSLNSLEKLLMFGRWNFTNLTSASNTFITLCGKPQEMLTENEAQSMLMT